MTIVKIRALKIRQNGSERVPWFGKDVPMDNRQITSISADGLLTREIVMSNGVSFVVGGLSKNFERLLSM
jgi:hypothetical protein